MKLIRSSQYWVDKKEVDVEDLKEKFTIKSKFEDNEPLCTLVVKGEKVGFPRNTIIGNEHDVSDITTTGNPMPFEVEFLGEMFDYQQPAITSFSERVDEGKYDLILSADTGSGKTVMILKMWTLVQVPLLVVVPKSDLMEQWVDRIMKFTGLEEEQIGIARQKKCVYEDKPVVVGMLHSLCKDNYPNSFKQHFGMVVFDELHKLGAKTFSLAGGLYPAKYRLGATATLRRADGMSEVFYSHLGDTIIEPTKDENPDPKILVVKYPRKSGRLPGWARSKVQRRGLLFSLLSKNEHRTQWICDLVNQVYSTGRQTLVLGERVAQLKNIIAMLKSHHKIPAEDIGLYIGKTSPNQRRRIAKECKIIVATTSMMSLGTDIPTLRGLVFATPLSDAEQAIGRVCRFSIVEHKPLVIDFVDMGHKDCFYWSRARQALYNRKGWEVVNAE